MIMQSLKISCTHLKKSIFIAFITAQEMKPCVLFFDISKLITIKLEDILVLTIKVR